MTSSLVAIFTTRNCAVSLFESFRFSLRYLSGISFLEQSGALKQLLERTKVGSSGSFGILPLFVGTILITIIAMLVAGPIGLMTTFISVNMLPQELEILQNLSWKFSQEYQLWYMDFLRSDTCSFSQELG